MGGRNTIKRTMLIEEATHLIELDVDKITKKGEGRILSVVVDRRKMKARERTVSTPHYLTDDFATYGETDYTYIYTDGSFRKEENWGEMLLGKPRIKAGGEVILSDGKSWFYKIYVNIDVNVEDAGQIELLCLLIGCEMAKTGSRPIRMGSDCQSALDVIEVSYSEGFYNSIAGWEKWEQIETFKIKAHPERYKAWGTWSFDDMGIYVADAVAGGQATPHETVSARDWLLRISARSMVGIEEEDGTPFIGSVKQRASETGLEQYYMEREGYRKKCGDFDQKWEGTNIALAPKLMRRNGGYEDRVTMSKLALDKRYDISKHNPGCCIICEEKFETQKHPMMGCIGHVVSEAREA